MSSKVTVSKGGKGEPAPAEHPLVGLRRQMDELFENFASGWAFPEFAGFKFGPLTTGEVDSRFDVTESDAAFEVSAELPGMAEKDIEVTLKDDLLVIKGEKKSEKESKEKDYVMRERRFGSVQRAMRFGDSINEDAVKATFDKGVLHITLPKKPEATARKKRIEIT